MIILIIASVIIIGVGAWFINRPVKGKQAAYSPFRRKLIYQAVRRKRRKSALLDPDRGKVIPFPIVAASPQGDGPSDTRGTENNK